MVSASSAKINRRRNYLFAVKLDRNRANIIKGHLILGFHSIFNNNSEDCIKNKPNPSYVFIRQTEKLNNHQSYGLDLFYLFNNIETNCTDFK